MVKYSQNLKNVNVQPRLLKASISHFNQSCIDNKDKLARLVCHGEQYSQDIDSIHSSVLLQEQDSKKNLQNTQNPQMSLLTSSLLHSDREVNSLNLHRLQNVAPFTNSPNNSHDIYMESSSSCSSKAISLAFKSFSKDNAKILIRKINSNIPKETTMEYNFKGNQKSAYDSTKIHVCSKVTSIELHVKNLNPCSVRFALLLKNIKRSGIKANLSAKCDDAPPQKSGDLTQLYPRCTFERLRNLATDFVIINPYQVMKFVINVDKLPGIQKLVPGDKIVFVSVMTALEKMSDVFAAIQETKKQVQKRSCSWNKCKGTLQEVQQGLSNSAKSNTNGSRSFAEEDRPENNSSCTKTNYNQLKDLILLSETTFTYLLPIQEKLLDHGLPISGFQAGAPSATCLQSETAIRNHSSTTSDVVSSSLTHVQQCTNFSSTSEESPIVKTSLCDNHYHESDNVHIRIV